MQEQVPQKHRRAQIDDSLCDMLKVLEQDTKDSGFPIKVKAVLKRFAHWEALDKRGLIPAVLITPGDGGSKPDAPTIGFIDERYPLSIIAVLKESDEWDEDGYPIGASITDQASDIHYSIERIINSSRTLGIEGVNVAETKIRDWRSSEIELVPYLLLKFRFVVVHRYRANQSV